MHPVTGFQDSQRDGGGCSRWRDRLLPGGLTDAVGHDVSMHPPARLVQREAAGLVPAGSGNRGGPLLTFATVYSSLRYSVA